MVVKFEKFLPLPEGKLAGDIVTSRQDTRNDREHNTEIYKASVSSEKNIIYSYLNYT